MFNLAIKFLFICLALLLPFAGYANTPITIGAIYNLTGDQSPLDTSSLEGAKLAVDQVNRQGGINGHPLRLEIVNGKTNTQVIQQQAKKLANKSNIAVVIGLSDNNMARSAIPIITRAHKIFLTSGATSPKLPHDFPQNFYMMAFSDNSQASAAASFTVSKLKKSDAVVVYDNNMAYTHDLAQYFADSYQHFGGKVIQTIAFNHRNLPITTIGKIKQAVIPNSVIYFAAGPTETPTMILAMRRAGITQPIIGGDSYTAEPLIAERVTNVYYTAHAYLSQASTAIKVQSFLQAFKQKYHYDPKNNFAALGYDSIMLITKALKSAANNPKKLSAAIQQAYHSFDGVSGSIKLINNIPEKTVFVIGIKGPNKLLEDQIHPSYLPNP